jgi:hypothetical protein
MLSNWRVGILVIQPVDVLSSLNRVVIFYPKHVDSIRVGTSPIQVCLDQVVSIGWMIM